MGEYIALFPEMWSVGYRILENIDELKASAVSVDSEFVASFAPIETVVLMSRVHK